MNEKQKKTQEALITLDAINANQIIEISKWEEIQNNLIKDNPFIEITNNETYIQAKSNRTALLKGRTSLLGKNGQEGIIKAKFKSILTGSMELLEGLAAITTPNYDKQQEEVKRYEAIIEEKRLEREAKAEAERLAEEKRIKEINDEIEALYEAHKLQIDELTFDGIAEFSLKVTDLKSVDTSKYEEFEITFFKMIERVSALLNKKEETLTIAEEQRLEGLRLKKQKEDLDTQQKAIDDAKKAKDDAEKLRTENYKTKLLENGYEKVNDNLFKKEEYSLSNESLKSLNESEFNARIEETDKLIKKKKILEEKEQTIIKKEEKEKVEKLQKRNKELQPYIVFIRDYDGLISKEDDEYEKKFLDIKKGAELHWDFENKEIAKREKLEAKRLKALQPDKDKAIETVKSLLITTLNEVKDEKVLLLLSEFTLEVQRLVQDYIIEIENL